MGKPTKRLGRGLDSLVSNLRTAVADAETATGVPDGPSPLTTEEERGPAIPAQFTDGAEARMASTETLKANPFQPRSNTTEENVLTLARSISASGLLQPIVVRSRGERLEIIAGERRWRAACSLGMKRVPVIVRSASDEQMLELALIENIHREDLNAVDRARAYRRFCDKFGVKPEELAERLGEDRTTVVNYLRLLDLPESIQGLLGNGALSMGHARCLAGVADEDRRSQLAEAVVQNDLSVRALEEIIRRGRKTDQPGHGGRTGRDPLAAAHVRDLERRFEAALKTKVTIQEGRRKGTGRLTIEYYSLDDFERICALLGVRGEEMDE